MFTAYVKSRWVVYAKKFSVIMHYNNITDYIPSKRPSVLSVGSSTKYILHTDIIYT